MDVPWSADVTKIAATANAGDDLDFTSKTLPAVGGARLDRQAPWGIELATGERCIAVQGAHGDYEGPSVKDKGRVVDFRCDNDEQVAVLRGFDEHRPVWRAAMVEFLNGPVHTVAVRTAWFGDPAAGANTPIS